MKNNYNKIFVAMTAHEIEAFFREVQIHASSLNSYYENFIRKKTEYRTLYQKPILTVSLYHLKSEIFLRYFWMRLTLHAVQDL